MTDTVELPRYITLQQAAELSQFSTETVRKAIQEGRLIASRPNGHEIRISIQHFQYWMENGQQSPVSSQFPTLAIEESWPFTRFQGDWNNQTPLELMEEISKMICWIPNKSKGLLSDPGKIFISLRPEDMQRVRTLPVTVVSATPLLEHVCRQHNVPFQNVKADWELESQNLWGRISYIKEDGKVLAFCPIIKPSSQVFP